MRVLVALLLKEALRMRYNLGLQLVLLLFIGLTAIITFGGLLSDQVPTIYIASNADTPFARTFRQFEAAVRFRRGNAPLDAKNPVFELILPADIAAEPHVQLRYRDQDENLAKLVYGILKVHVIRYLRMPIPIQISVLNQEGAPLEDADIPVVAHTERIDVKSRKELAMLMLSTIAITIVSFNLFTILFSEEKSAKALLAQLLSPAGPIAVLASKFVFYLALTSILVGSVALIYAPHAVRTGSFWAVVALGSVTYMSLATIIVAVTERQSTASLLTLGYLFLLSIVVLLSQELTLFAWIREHLPESYIFSFLARIYAGNEVDLGEHDVLRFAQMAGVLLFVSTMLFKRRNA